MKLETSFATMVERRARVSGKAIVEKGHPYFLPVDSQQQACEQNGTAFTSFAHYDYLGLNRQPEVLAGSAQAAQALGTSVGASRLVGGERTAHRALEGGLADFFGFEASLTLVSGYLTNFTLLEHLMGPRDLVMVDELAHNSIVVGTRAGRFECITFRHNDFDDLDKKLGENRGRFRNVLIVVEGLYSMDGDIPDLPQLVEIKNRHNAWLLVDEAHSFGVLGATGRGLCEHWGVDPQNIELYVGTLSKALVSSGGFIGSSRNAIDWLSFTLPGFVYSVGLSPPTIGSAHAALAFLRDNPGRVAALHRQSVYFLSRAREAGLNPGSAIGRGVVPLLFESASQTMYVAQRLMMAGIYAPPIVQIGVPKDQPRIRFFISASHTDAEIDRAIDVIADAVYGDLRGQPVAQRAAAGL